MGEFLLTAEQFDALCLLARGEKVALSEEIAKRLVRYGYIERGLGSWTVTSRGHALVMQGNQPPTDAA